MYTGVIILNIIEVESVYGNVLLELAGALIVDSILMLIGADKLGVNNTRAICKIGFRFYCARFFSAEEHCREVWLCTLSSQVPGSSSLRRSERLLPAQNTYSLTVDCRTLSTRTVLAIVNHDFGSLRHSSFCEEFII
jgi:hypothetical protein